MDNLDKPIDIDEQIMLMKRYIVFSKKIKIRRLIEYTGYFRLSRYGKYLISFTNVIGSKPDQELLFDIYNFDVDLRNILFKYSKKAEIQVKSYLSNAISLKTNDPTFYINSSYYNASKSEKHKIKKQKNINNFNNRFLPNIKEQENKLRSYENRYPELREYRQGGERFQKNIPCWAAFSYFEFGTITNIYNYLSGDLRKEVLKYGYSKTRYGKEVTKQMDTWLDAIRNLRNVCSHHNILVGRTSSIVLVDYNDNDEILKSSTDLFSRIYALKKVLNPQDSLLLKKDLQKLIKKSKIDVHQFNILPNDWESLFDRINYL